MIKKRRGFGFVEVLCSAVIFFMVIASVFRLKIFINKINHRQENIQRYCCFLSGLKYNLLKNTTYEQIKFLKENNKLNISKDKIDVDMLGNGDFNKNFNEIFNETISVDDYPRVKVEIEDFRSEKVFKIKLKVFFLVNNKIENISTEFLKGNYQ
ncbi:type IV pilus modification PilV family protein [Haloimpatiens lingqiaonensis]|uniref:type IV pilus modification PilV family protein n=1 Tax=Haloimpatiens lingqiaonensis TaxID=1380675 RepID=UPI0010FD9E33|nr:hypothetical protein [Haloimpatiens lingqiaonensis]